MFAQGAITLIADAVKAIVIVVIMLTIDVALSLMTFVTLPLVFVARRDRAPRDAQVVPPDPRAARRDERVRAGAPVRASASSSCSGAARPRSASTTRSTPATATPTSLQIRADAAMYALVEAIGYDRGRRSSCGGPPGTRVAATPRRSASVVGVHRVHRQVLHPDPRSVGEVRRDAGRDGGERAHLPAARHRRVRRRVADPSATAATRRARADDRTRPLVELAGVHFSYGAEPVLRGVDLRVPRGATVAVVGATGSGKSTVIKLLTRLYERERGAIRLDGVDVRDLPLAELRRRITVVSQDVHRCSRARSPTTSRSASRTTRERLEARSRRVGLDRALARRGDGTRRAAVAERGANFSAGERQLVAFARALLRDPEILVLDEATAHVDPEAEELIERGVHELMKGRTTLVIAHRLSTIRNADLIVVMDKGQIVEQGTHDELVAQGGLYAALERRSGARTRDAVRTRDPHRAHPRDVVRRRALRRPDEHRRDPRRGVHARLRAGLVAVGLARVSRAADRLRPRLSADVVAQPSRPSRRGHDVAVARRSPPRGRAGARRGPLARGPPVLHAARGAAVPGLRAAPQRRDARDVRARRARSDRRDGARLALAEPRATDRAPRRDPRRSSSAGWSRRSRPARTTRGARR